MTEIRLGIARRQKSFVFVHSDLTGLIQTLAKDSYKYVLNFIDDYSDLTMLYFLKHKSNILLATTKYLADITPYGHVKCLQIDSGTEFTSVLFNGYLYLIESNMGCHLLILCIKMELLNSCGELFLWQGVSLLSQNCPKTCGFTH